MSRGPSPKNKNGSTQTEEQVQFEQSSDNVFADLAIPNPSLALVKAELVQHIRNLISEPQTDSDASCWLAWTRTTQDFSSRSGASSWL